MHMRVTLDDEMVIRDIEAVTMAGPYDMCPAITDNYKRLVGVRLPQVSPRPVVMRPRVSRAAHTTMIFCGFWDGCISKHVASLE